MSGLDFVEVSFEVANKVGGIHQVLKSKSSFMEEEYGDAYLTVGFYDGSSEFDEFAPRENPYSHVFSRLEKEGIKCYYGVWDVQTQPRSILVDATGLEKNLDELKSEYWDKYGVDSLEAGQDFEEPLRWGYAVSRLIEELEKEEDFVVQLHEWLSAVPALELDSPTVFTAHATVLGRALANSGYELNQMVKDGEIKEKHVQEMGVAPKHTLERAAAENSDVFTTVSDITAREASAVLGVEPDKVLPNGFNIEDYPSLEKLSVNHTQKKEKVLDFIKAYFEPYYSVDLQNDPRIFFTSGRYEYHNKGFDMLIEALGEVNERPGENIYFFFFVPAANTGPDLEVLENKSLYEELKSYVDDQMPKIRGSMLNAVTSGEDPVKKAEDIISRTEKLDSLQKNFRDKKKGSPPLSAFNLEDKNDEILSGLKANGLTNTEDDRVKIIFYPTYLSAGDNLLSMGYEEAVVASSAGFFPSYYEPWGYTPVETAANGALALTTDLAGFGRFLEEEADKTERKGIKVLERTSCSYEESVENLALLIEEFSNYDRTEITERKHNARKLAHLTSWNKLGDKYIEAHKLAVEKNEN